MQKTVLLGATFPEIKSGIKDYDNLIYNLGSCEAFNDRLVKGVEINYPPEIGEEDIPVRLVELINSPKSAVFRNETTKKRYTIEKGASLSAVSESFNNIFVTDIGKIDDFKKAVQLSNGQILKKNDIFFSNVYSSTSEVLVYGKIPRRSIKIPVCWGGTYSPDFMYVIKNSDGTIQYNFVIETKDVSSNGSLRDDEKRKILCGIEFFKQLKAEGYNVIFEEQLKTDNIVAMIKKSVAK